jgi:hypothetical protein
LVASGLENRLKRLTHNEREDFIYLADILNRRAEAGEANAHLAAAQAAQDWIEKALTG